MKVLGFGLIAVLLSVSCGGGSGYGSGGDIGGVNVQVTSPVGAVAVDSGLVIPITVTVTNDSDKAGVVWSVGVQHNGDPSGTLSDITADLGHLQFSGAGSSDVASSGHRDRYLRYRSVPLCHPFPSRCTRR